MLKIMTVRLFVSLIALYKLILTQPTTNATINATSTSSTDVQNAINLAVSGDTTILPASSSTTWSTTISIPNTKNIMLNFNKYSISKKTTSTTLLTITNNTTTPTRVTKKTFSKTTTDKLLTINKSF